MLKNVNDFLLYETYVGVWALVVGRITAASPSPFISSTAGCYIIARGKLFGFQFGRCDPACRLLIPPPVLVFDDAHLWLTKRERRRNIFYVYSFIFSLYKYNVICNI